MEKRLKSFYGVDVQDYYFNSKESIYLVLNFYSF